MKELKIGEKAPAFSLKNYDGKEFDLQKLLKENKLTVVMFVSTECPVSNAYNTRMVKLYDAFSKKSVAFVGINSNKAEDTNAITGHAKKNGFKFPILKDTGNKIADLYAAQVTPEVFVVGSDGKLIYHGRIDDNRDPGKVSSNDLSDALTKLLDGKEPSVSVFKAFGCTIKRVD
jgi:peroxiredoxin